VVENSPPSGPPRGSCFEVGCFAPLVAAVVGIVVWRIVDSATPCNCPGEPDDAWVESMNATPYGILAFLATLIPLAILLLRRRFK
jgi:hypothetical protein